jgi:hypothetical protein
MPGGSLAEKLPGRAGKRGARVGEFGEQCPFEHAVAGGHGEAFGQLPGLALEILQPAQDDDGKFGLGFKATFDRGKSPRSSR